MKPLALVALVLTSLALVAPTAQAQHPTVAETPPDDRFRPAASTIITGGAVYVCPQCECAAHHPEQHFDRDGVCPHCGMALVEQPDPSAVDRVEIHAGSGSFLLRGGAGRPDDVITIYYHRPQRFTPQSPIVIVVPGAGRNANDYRDAWRSASEEHGVLVLSPHYPEASYAFEDYHLGGLLSINNLDESVTFSDTTNEAFLDEDVLAYTVNGDSAAWIFGDFDRLFEAAVSASGSAQTEYDLFGHSAGGQILHRLVLFHPASRARRVLAANSGFYTLPTHDAPPFGVGGTPLSEADLRRSFAERLVVFLGENDDAHETGGTLLRSASADRQGAHRRARGRYFYRRAEAEAARRGVPFNWSIEVIPGVGHDFEGMSEGAAAYLYGGTDR